MGRQLDLVHLFRAPEHVVCPWCKELSDTDFDDFDMDSSPVERGIISCEIACTECEKEFNVSIHCSWVTDVDLPFEKTKRSAEVWLINRFLDYSAKFCDVFVKKDFYDILEKTSKEFCDKGRTWKITGT